MFSAVESVTHIGNWFLLRFFQLQRAGDAVRKAEVDDDNTIGLLF